MYATFAGTNMIPLKVTPITVLPPELHLKRFQMIGPAHCAAWINQIFQKCKMRKGILVLLSFFLFISLCAQKSSITTIDSEGAKKGKNNFRGGIRGGFTGSIITGDTYSFQGYNKFGGYAGVFVNVPVSRNGRWFIQPELNFIMKGCKHSPKFDENGMIIGSVRDEYVLQLMYGQIPVLVKWKIIKGLELEFGPAFGILFKNIDVEKVNRYINVGAPPFARFEFSGIIGIGYLFFNHLGVSLRYESSLLPVRKYTAAHAIYLDRGQYNQTFAFSVYYQF